ncbi:Kir-like protein [Plasmodium coatneyi]|uniref:Kir-like protein n=1 Tax=Plasmodium coatneyi TaxID=208452 RepID=A0A1B1E6C6_9APIC|nr:Kir-like protein [Plasmodium coatneyi]ANQ10548.1 Kir-like protein [Plasmodium coatneyi]
MPEPSKATTLTEVNLEGLPSKTIYNKLDGYQTEECKTANYGSSIKTTLQNAGVDENTAQQIINTLCYISKSVKKLKELPSHKEFYEKFDLGWTNCTGIEPWPNQTKVKLDEDDDQNIKNHAEKIVGGLCYVNKMKGQGKAPAPQNNDFCNFFYFWVGNMLFKAFKDGKKNSFNESMQKIKTAVETHGTDHGCTFACTNKKHSKFFAQRKLLFYFTSGTRRTYNNK